MMFIPGLRRELRVLALLLTAYFMSLTWTVSAVSTDTVLTTNATTIQATTTQTSPTSKTSASTTKAPSSAVTNASIKASATPVPTAETGRKFDGASFVGGIILGVVLAIIFILAFKWWQSKNKSYHSL